MMARGVDKRKRVFHQQTINKKTKEGRNPEGKVQPCCQVQTPASKFNYHRVCVRAVNPCVQTSTTLTFRLS